MHPAPSPTAIHHSLQQPLLTYPLSALQQPPHLPLTRPPRTAGVLAQLRPGYESRSHQVELRRSGPCGSPTSSTRGRRSTPATPPASPWAAAPASYADVQRLSWSVGRALARSGVRPGDKVAVLSGNDPVAFGCVFGISRAAAVWCPVNPRNEAAENQELLGLFDCRCLIFAAAFAPLVAKIVSGLPRLTTLVCLDGARSARSGRGRGARRGRLRRLAGRRERRAVAGRPGRRRRDDRGHRRHHRQAQGRPAHRAQHRDDDRLDADELPVRPPAPGVPRARPAHPRGRGALLPRHGAGRRGRHHAGARPGGVPRARRAAPRHPRVPPADPDLPAARPPGAARRRPQLAAVPLVRGRADVHLPAGAGHRGDRPGPRPAVRPDRGPHDDLHPGAARPPAPGRDPRQEQVRLRRDGRPR